MCIVLCSAIHCDGGTSGIMLVTRVDVAMAGGDSDCMLCRAFSVHFSAAYWQPHTGSQRRHDVMRAAMPSGCDSALLLPT